ncbi:MAG TPA: GMC family oxidoreductase N-terminal domain-containing protein [Steroidobacteraceae bacterium]|nr:GMC family oxidoreductase N-terminal domain-containing protein [Steroidobacteraceae bacterium]
MADKAFDYIIVGAGSAGCVLANRLSADPAHSVLLLEAGGPDRGYRRMRMPLAWRDTFLNPRFGWGYLSEPEPHADGRRIPVPRGKVLGGSSSVNGMMYSRGHPSDYDGWRDLGCRGWSYAEVLPYFRRAEGSWRGESLYHGAEGPLTVARHMTDALVYPKLIATAGKLGYRHLDDFHGLDVEGFSAPEFNVHRGRRASTASRYLHPARRRPNLVVATGALARRVLFDGDRATGIEYEHNGRTERAQVDREVILAAGAFNSPQLLLLSGIGPAAELEALGIRPVHDLPGVGKGLQDHQSVGVVFEASGPITFESKLRLDRLILSVLRWQLFGTGSIADLPVGAQGFLRTWPETTGADVQFLVSPVSMLARPWFPGWRKGAGHVFAAANVVLHPDTRGEVRLRSADPRDPPRILFNLLGAPRDRDTLRAMIRFTRRFFATAPASDLVKRELIPGASIESDADVDAHIRRSVATAMHPTSTCAMGIDESAVVDAQLAVRGLKALRVVDASIMPRIVGGNTNAPVIMIAEKAVDLILGRPALSPAALPAAAPLAHAAARPEAAAPV